MTTTKAKKKATPAPPPARPLVDDVRALVERHAREIASERRGGLVIAAERDAAGGTAIGLSFRGMTRETAARLLAWAIQNALAERHDK